MVLCWNIYGKKQNMFTFYFADIFGGKSEKKKKAKKTSKIIVVLGKTGEDTKVPISR